MDISITQAERGLSGVIKRARRGRKRVQRKAVDREKIKTNTINLRV